MFRIIIIIIIIILRGTVGTMEHWVL